MAVENLKKLLLLGGLFQQMQPKVLMHIMALRSCNPIPGIVEPRHISAALPNSTAFQLIFARAGDAVEKSNQTTFLFSFQLFNVFLLFFFVRFIYSSVSVLRFIKRGALGQAPTGPQAAV